MKELRNHLNEEIRKTDANFTVPGHINSKHVYCVNVNYSYTGI